MLVWFIRHALAVEADLFPGPDMQRPLTPVGRRQAMALFKHLAAVRNPPDVVICSGAVRAGQTAALLCKMFHLPPPHIDERLNPGCRFRVIKQIVHKAGERNRTVAIVGHEPDFSVAISEWTSDGHLHLRMAKCALAELELRPGKPARLIGLYSPDLFPSAVKR